MKTRILTTATTFALTLLSACSTFAPQPTETPEPTRAPTELPTEVPTATATVRLTPISAATYTPAPTNTPQPALSPTPLSEWRGVPIMPGAFEIDEDDDLVSFQIDMTVSEVVDYYNYELAGLGWDLLTGGTLEDDHAINMYMKDGMVMILTIVQLQSGGDSTVIIALRNN